MRRHILFMAAICLALAQGDVDFMPQDLTSDTSHPPYVVTESDYFVVYAGYKCFDNNFSQAWVSNGNPHGTHWIQVDGGSGHGTVLHSYQLKAEPFPYSSRSPSAFTMAGSNDGSAWTTLDTRSGETGWTGGQTRTYLLSSPGTIAYRYFRLTVTNNDGDSDFMSIAEMYLYGGAGGRSMLPRHTVIIR